jgi:prolyl 4-hydroxylase
MLRLIAIASFLAWSNVLAQEVSYGVDCSFPIHSTDFRCGDLLGDRKKVYDDFMEGCRKHHGRKASRCDDTERDRIEMNNRQPQSMVNYTSTGFMKIRAPKEVMKLLSSHWQNNKDKMNAEVWPAGSTYVNHW